MFPNRLASGSGGQAWADGGSSNGRTADFDSVNRGSNPRPPAKARAKRHVSCVIPRWPPSCLRRRSPGWARAAIARSFRFPPVSDRTRPCRRRTRRCSPRWTSRPRTGWPAGADADRRARPRGRRVRRRPRSSALAATCCPTATCWSRKPTPRPSRRTARGIKGWITKLVDAARWRRVPSANRITLLRDADGDGVARTRSVFLEGLNSPFGMALVGNDLYVANTDASRGFRTSDGADAHHRARRQGGRPAGRADQPPLDQERHRQPGWPRLYVTVGSNSNAGENGIEVEEGRAAIWEIDPATGRHRVFASGLRNPVGLAWEPVTGALWTAVNERDELGSDLVPDYMTAVQGRRLLRLAVQLLRPACRRAREAAAAGPGRAGDRARLRARARTPPRSASPSPRPGALPAPFAQRRFRRPARLVEPQAAERLQGRSSCPSPTAGRPAMPVTC